MSQGNPALSGMGGLSDGGLDRQSNLRRWILGLIAVGLIIYAYGISRVCLFQVTPTSLFHWLSAFWGRGGEYAHGYLVPVVAAGVFWWKWQSVLRFVPPTTSNWGLLVTSMAMLIYVIGVRAQQPRMIAGSLVVLLFGVVLYLWGWRWAKEVWFPCAFLFFMIPLNFLEDSLGFQLRLLVAHVSAFLLNSVGVDVVVKGTGILSTTGRFEPLDVANPCSGIRSLVALMALTSVYGYLVMDKAWKKWVLFFSSLPFAVLGNLVRITTVALVAQGFGSGPMGGWHDFSGYIVFTLAILCMLGLGALLNLRYRDLLEHWLQEEQPPVSVAKQNRPVSPRQGL